MGFFSNDCKGCGESIKAPYNLPTDIAWQNECVTIHPFGIQDRGSYDGYGRIKTEHRLVDTVGQKRNGWWHTRCYEAAGSPVYSGPSEHSHDQGFFYDRTEAAR